MNKFNLKVVTVSGECYSGDAELITLRTIDGEVGIMAGHADYVAAVQICRVSVSSSQNDTFSAVCGGGFLTVYKNDVRLVTDSFEVDKDIDKGKTEEELIELQDRLDTTNGERERSVIKNSIKRLNIKLEIANEYSTRQR